MNKLAVTVVLFATILLNTACATNNYKNQTIISSSQITQSRDSDIIDMPIEVTLKGEKEVKNVQIKEESTLKEKVEVIVKAISEECFNGLTIKATIYKNDTAKVELKEPSDIDNSRVSWAKDYLSEQNKAQTINTIVKNMLQEEYKGSWIKSIQLYYQGNLVGVD